MAVAGLAAVMLAACGGGNDVEGTVGGVPTGASTAGGGSGGGTSSTGNQPPTIGGAPSQSVMQGSTYSFTPQASDPNNDSLRFSVTGLPRWASFSPMTGRITGTPSQSDVGTYSNIRLSVSDGVLTASLRAFSIEVVSTGTALGTATLMWQPPTHYTDGTPLTIDGYRFYAGPSQRELSLVEDLRQPGISSYMMSGLSAGTWFFAVTVYDTQGVESSFSNVASKTI